MRFHHILLPLVVLHVFLFMPPFGVLLWSGQPTDDVFKLVDVGGLGPYIHYVYETGAQVDGEYYGGPQHGYLSLYFGSFLIDLILVFAYVFIFKYEKNAGLK